MGPTDGGDRAEDRQAILGVLGRDVGAQVGGAVIPGHTHRIVHKFRIKCVKHDQIILTAMSSTIYEYQRLGRIFDRSTSASASSSSVCFRVAPPIYRDFNSLGG